MEKPRVKYKQGGYLYQLAEGYAQDISRYINPGKPICGEWSVISNHGLLIIKDGYAWDGGSSPFASIPLIGGWTRTKATIRCSLVHDALYQLIRTGFLPHNYKAAADMLLHDIAIEDGMFAWRAKAWLKAVSGFGDPSTQKKSEPVILTAP